MLNEQTGLIVPKPKVSVVVPAWNEADNLTPLVKRVSMALANEVSDYEIIIVDDHSNDHTFSTIGQLQSFFPVRLLRKIGERGKAQSLLQGFAAAQYEIIAMIDADLQYPPEAFGAMIKLLTSGVADVVVANRKYEDVSFLRRVASHTFRYTFAQLLHGIKVDVQSGLKVFRSEIIQRITIAPTPWTFDLEFLVKAMHAGYKIDGIEVPFVSRTNGASKVKFLQTIFEIGTNAIKQKFKNLETVPFLKQRIDRDGEGFHFKGQEYIHHTALSFSESAFKNLTSQQKVLVSGFAAVLTGAGLINWHTTLVVIFAVITIFYFIDLLYYFHVILQSLSRQSEINISEDEVDQSNRDWPTYSILCPLYKEWQVIPQFVKAMAAMDYPKDKLQVMLLLEQDDKETIMEVQKMQLPEFFETHVVPHSLPKTKPKACNYGLKRAKGEYIVIYDAEDIPDPRQLKKAILAFEKRSPNTICVQAKLNFYNPRQNLLTRIFTAEYSLWFDLVLTGLQAINAPIPLGGTSNHFKSSILRKIHGWDAFNVTEDCDLGVRLAKLGFKTAIVNSVTMEEANSHLGNWFWQRSRWLKGYIQTYFVHMRNPLAFFRKRNRKQFYGFQIIVGGKIFLMLINPLMWITTILYFASRSTLGPFIESLFPTSILYMGIFSFVFGNFFYLYYYMIGCARQGQFGLIKYTYLVPIYWLFMSAASWLALFEFISKPHYWAKTKHGLHLNSKTENNEVPILPSLGSELPLLVINRQPNP